MNKITSIPVYSTHTYDSTFLIFHFSITKPVCMMRFYLSQGSSADGPKYHADCEVCQNMNSLNSIENKSQYLSTYYILYTCQILEPQSL